MHRKVTEYGRVIILGPVTLLAGSVGSGFLAIHRSIRSVYFANAYSLPIAAKLIRADAAAWQASGQRRTVYATAIGSCFR